MKWYKAKIKKIVHGGVIDVQYFDGEDDNGLGPHNLKPFKPYTVGEIIDVSYQDQFIQAKVVQRLKNNRLKVRSPLFRGDYVTDEMGVKRIY